VNRSQAGIHRYSPTTRTHRPVPRGRHRLADRPLAGVQRLRLASTAVMVLITLAVRLFAHPLALWRLDRSI
jgi:hypothetical protein